MIPVFEKYILFTKKLPLELINIIIKYAFFKIVKKRVFKPSIELLDDIINNPSNWTKQRYSDSYMDSFDNFLAKNNVLLFARSDDENVTFYIKFNRSQKGNNIQYFLKEIVDCNNIEKIIEEILQTKVTADIWQKTYEVVAFTRYNLKDNLKDNLRDNLNHLTIDITGTDVCMAAIGYIDQTIEKTIEKTIENTIEETIEEELPSKLDIVIANNDCRYNTIFREDEFPWYVNRDYDRTLQRTNRFELGPIYPDIAFLTNTFEKLRYLWDQEDYFYMLDIG